MMYTSPKKTFRKNQNYGISQFTWDANKIMKTRKRFPILNNIINISINKCYVLFTIILLPFR